MSRFGSYTADCFSSVAYNVTIESGQTYLTKSWIFAEPEEGISDGIKTDQNGNVYSGCGDGRKHLVSRRHLAG